MNTACPCCRSAPAINDNTEFRCPACAHVWRTAALPEGYYASCAGRNTGVNHLEQKYADRMSSIAHLVRDGMRILEIGCADGAFGALIKKLAGVHYVGVEISPDASLAESRLDHVHRGPAGELEAAPFDLLLSFHVLEHLPDIQAEVAHWHRLLKAGGQLVVEVPHRAGHALLDRDRHPEHLHQFSPASLTILLENAGFTPVQMSTGHFESAVYSDGLRIEAQVCPTSEQKAERLLARFAAQLPGQFVVFGVGGDFRNYVEFLLPRLSVTALCDSNPACWRTKIGKYTVAAYDPVAHAGLPVLIASTRHTDEIRKALLAQGIPEGSIISLNQIYG